MNRNKNEKTRANAQPGAPRTHVGRRLRSRVVLLGTAIAIAAGTVLVSASGASAGTPPVVYSGAHEACTTVQNGSSVTDILYAGRPVAAANYTGTTYLYWQAQIQVDVNGVWDNDASPVDGAYAHIWGRSGSELTPIYWGNEANNYGIAVQVPDGYYWRIVGETYWWNGSRWFVENNTLAGACNFS